MLIIIILLHFIPVTVALNAILIYIFKYFLF